MDEIPIAGREDERDLFKQFTTHYDAPAYMRRARNVQAAYDALFERCRLQREDFLGMVRSRLGELQGLAGEWSALLPYLADAEQIPVLDWLVTAIEPRLRVTVTRTNSARTLRRALLDLNESLARFNRRWEAFVGELKFDDVNALRDGYNRYYILEKECAIRSPTLARQGFRRLEPMTAAEVYAVYPRLPLPALS